MHLFVCFPFIRISITRPAPPPTLNLKNGSDSTPPPPHSSFHEWHSSRLTTYTPLGPFKGRCNFPYKNSIPSQLNLEPMTSSASVMLTQYRGAHFLLYLWKRTQTFPGEYQSQRENKLEIFKMILFFCSSKEQYQKVWALSKKNK